MRLAKEPTIHALMQKVHCIADDSKRNPGFFPGWMKIRFKDGREEIYDQRWEMGTPNNPIDMDEVMTKFRNNLEHYYTDEQIDRLSELIWSLDQLEDLSSLTNALKVEKVPELCR